MSNITRGLPLASSRAEQVFPTLTPAQIRCIAAHGHMRSTQPGEVLVQPDTMRIAEAAIPEGNIYLKLRSFLGTVFDDELFAPLFPRRGQPALAPWRLALVTVMQFARRPG